VDVRGHLKSDVTGVYNTNAPYGGCGGERIFTDTVFAAEVNHM